MIRLPFSHHPIRSRRFLYATIAVLLAATTITAQFATFNGTFEGELWGVRQELAIGGGGYPAGVAYTNGALFVADAGNATVIKYDSSGAVVALPGADWAQTAVVSSPAYGLVPNELAAANVLVDGVPTTAVLVSDGATNRMLAFDTGGVHLFTLQLDRPGSTDTVLLINGLAMGPGARFVLTTGGATPALALEGSFAAAWTNEYRTNGAVLAYKDLVAIAYNAGLGRFEATPVAVLTGTEGNNLAPANQEPYGVVFDAAGNLYSVDTVTERLNVYDQNFAYRFTFGTPAPDGTTLEFYQSFGMAFWPDANGGRLIIADALNNRLAVYRPNLAAATLDYQFAITSLGDGQPMSVAVDPATAKLAAADSAVARVWVIETPNLATFDLQMLDGNGAPAGSVCVGQPYQVRFSLTVPAGRQPVGNIVPQLSINGGAVADVPTPSGAYPSTPLQAGDVVTYTYSLVMPAGAPVGDALIEAGATASTVDVLFRQGLLPVANCTGAVPTITAAPSVAPQVSGWTPVFTGDTYTVTLTALDDTGVSGIEYQLIGANDDGTTIAPVTYLAPWSTTQQVVVSLLQMGDTTIKFRARDSDNRTSAWQEFNVKLVQVLDRQTNEGQAESFAVGVPVGLGYSFSATNLPEGFAINTSTGLISGQATFNASGVYQVVVTETQGLLSSSVAFTWTVLHINRPPVIVQPTVPAAGEGQAFYLDVQGSDPDGDPAFFTVYGRSIPLGYDLPPAITIDPATGVISGTFPFDSEREYVLTVGLSECATALPSPPCVGDVPGERLATLTQFTVSVSNGNRAPFIINPGAQANSEGDLVTLPITASDPDVASDSQVLVYSAANLPPGLSIDSITGVISGTIGYNALASYAVTVQVDDAVAPPASASFNWTVANVDRAPTVSSPDRSSIEGEVTTVTIAHTNPSGGNLVFTMTGLPATHTIDAATGTITGIFSYESAGAYNVTVTAFDGTATGSVTFVWTVFNVNRHPVLNPVDQFSLEGQTVSVQIAGSDPDGDTLTYSMNGLPAGFTIDPATGIISGTFDFDSAGVYTVNVGAADAALAVLKTFTWTVADVNRPPTVTTPGPQSDAENGVVSVAIAASDADLNALSFSAANLPPGLSIDPATGVISGTLTYDAAGIYTVTVSVSDGVIGATPTSVTFTWTVSNVNRPPTVAAGDRTNAEGDVLANVVVSTASDPEFTALTYSATGLPAGLMINPVTGTVSGTLAYSAAGSHVVTITVDDGEATASAVFTWTVTNTNAPPTVTPPPNQSSFENDPISIAVVAEDYDGDTLTYGATGLPPGLSIDPISGVIAGTLGYDAAGTYVVVVTVTDGLRTVSATFDWTVANVNRPPTASSADQTNAEGDTVSVAIGASDPDGGVLTFSAAGLPPGTSVNAATGVITGTLGFDSAGTYSVVVTVSDGVLSATTAFTWTVNNTNRPPALLNDSSSVIQGAAVTIDVLGNDADPDGTPLTLAGVGIPSSGTAVANANGTVTYTASPTFTGDATFVYTVTDGSLTATALVTVHVLPSNLPPICTATALPAEIWPPNHRKVNVSLIGIADPDGDAVTIRFTGILQDEPTNSPGQGNTMQDGGIEQYGARAWVRAERTGTGDGRIYLISYTATDTAGASCSGEVAVGVPHDERGTPAVLSPGRWNSLNGQLVSAPPPPVAVDDAVTVSKGQEKTIAVLSNDAAYGLPLTVSIVSQPSKGSATVKSDGTISYKAPGNWTGTTSFSYGVSNGFGGSDTAIVMVTITNAPHEDDEDNGGGSSSGGGGGGGDDDDDDCGDPDHDHTRDSDHRDRDHKRGDHDRCRHS